MTKKPSFLERLTGVLEEEAEEKKDVSFEIGEEIGGEDEDFERKKISPSRSPDENNNKRIKKESLSEMPKEKNNEWLPDTEGQLTIDVYQTPTDIVIKSTIAGVNPDDLDITITNDMVTIKGKREKDEIVENSDYYYQECYWGSFSRSVILPVDVEAEKAEASLKNGILTIRLPKIEKIKTKKIKVIG